MFGNWPDLRHEGRRGGVPSNWLLGSDLEVLANREGKVGRGTGF